MTRPSLTVLLAAAALCACATGPQLPPGPPTFASIEAKWTELAASKVPPVSYLTIGSALDDEACYGWLDQQILGSQQSSAAQGALGMVGSIAAATGHPAGVGAAVGTGALSSLLGNAQSYSPVGNDPVAALGLVVRQRQLWQAVVGTPMTREDAFAFLGSYHRLCSLGGIRWAMHVAAMTAPVSVANSSQGFTTSIQGRQQPPIINVGERR